MEKEGIFFIIFFIIITYYFGLCERNTNQIIQHNQRIAMSVVGLDFGNQNAVIAAAGRGGVDVILNGNSNRLNA